MKLQRTLARNRKLSIKKPFPRLFETLERREVLAGDMQITEFTYSSADGEFVEFTNVGDAPVDMAGWSFDDADRTPGSKVLTAFGTVQPGQSVILTESLDLPGFRAAWGLDASVKIIGANSEGLSRNDELNLYDNNNQLVDRLTFGDQNIPGTIRTQNKTGWAPVNQLADQTIDGDWVLSAVNDVQNSRTSTNGDIGNPGHYNTFSPGILLIQSGARTDVTEGGATDTYTIALRSQPTNDVFISLTPDSQVNTNVPQLIFTAANWNVAQTVTVTAVDDGIIEGIHSGVITHTVTSVDGNYTGRSVPNVTARITDNEPTGASPTITENTASPQINLPAAGPGFLSGVINDPTDPAATLGIDFLISDPDTVFISLFVDVVSDNPAVVSNANLVFSGNNLKITPTGVGFATITITVTDGLNPVEYVINYAASAASVNPTTTRFHVGSADASTAIAIDANYMFVADDENQVLRLYDRNNSGLPINSFDMSSSLDVPNGDEVDIEGSTRVGSTIYWIGSHSNNSSGGNRDTRERIFSTTVSGSGAASTLTFGDYYAYLEDDLIAWDDANGHGLGAGALGLAASAADGVVPETTGGFNIEGLTMAPDGTTAYVSFRAPLESTSTRTSGLIIPVPNFAAVVNDGVQGTPFPGAATFGAPIFLDLGGRGIRSIERNGAGQYLIVAGTATGGNNFKLYTWTGLAADAPVPQTTDLTALLAGGSFESIVDLPASLVNGAQIQLLVDNGDTDYYGDGSAAKALPHAEWKKFRSEIVTLAPGIANAAQALVVTPLTVNVNEVSTEEFTVKLASQPAGEVTVNVARVSGDTDFYVFFGETLTFDNANWNTPQSVRIYAAGDPDLAAGAATFAVSSSGIATVNVTATEVEAGRYIEGVTGFGHLVGESNGNNGWRASTAADAGYLAYGPYTTDLNTGTYTANFRLQIPAVFGSTPIATIDVWEANTGRQLAKRIVRASDFTNSNTYQNFPLPFEVTSDDAVLEFRTYWHDKADATLRYVEIVDRQPVQFEAETDLAHLTGHVDGDGWTATAAADSASFLAYGPYTTAIDTGLYTAQFRLQSNVSGLSTAPVVTIDVWDSHTNQLVAKRTLRGTDFITPNMYQNFDLKFEVTSDDALLEFRTYWYDTADVKLDRVRLEPRQPIQFEAETDLGHLTGHASGDSWGASAATESESFLAYGPYTTAIDTGLYTAYFRLQTNGDAVGNTPVVTIDVWDSHANELVAKRVLRGSDFEDSNVYQDFALKFEVTSDDALLEFRTYWHDTANVKLDRVRVETREPVLFEAETDFGHLTGHADGDGWAATKATESESFLAYGPYTTTIDTGLYTAAYRLQSDGTAAANVPVVTIDVWDLNAGRALATRVLHGSDFSDSNVYRTFKLPFEVTSDDAVLEFRTYWHDTANVKLDRVQVKDLEFVQFETELDLAHQTGHADGTAWAATQATESAAYLAYGPYTGVIDTGRYTAAYRLQTNGAAAAAAPVVTIDVWDSHAGTILAQRVLRGSDFATANVYQDFLLPFEVTSDDALLEFHTFWHDTADVKEDFVRIVDEIFTADQDV